MLLLFGCGFIFELVQVGDYVVWVIWFVCFVYIMFVQDQLVMCVEQEFGWNYFYQFVFYFVYVFVWCQFCVVGDVEDMCVYCYYWFVECGVEYYVGGFVFDIWQCFQCFVIVWYFIVMFFQQDCVGGDYVFCFGVEQFDGGDVWFQVIFVECKDFCWCVGDWEQLVCGFVDVDVGGLC